MVFLILYFASRDCTDRERGTSSFNGGGSSYTRLRLEGRQQSPLTPLMDRRQIVRHDIAQRKGQSIKLAMFGRQLRNEVD